MSPAKPAPYPGDTRSKGWRFEVDMETVKASDTWLKAKTGAVRGALLLLWSEAWQQSPCGTLPNDDELIALLIDMPPATFTKNRAVLLRGWWLASDGRLYHDTITNRVLAMLDKRANDAQRAATRRARKAEAAGSPPGITQESRVTHGGVGYESDTKHQAPSTKHQVKPPPPSETAGDAPETGKDQGGGGVQGQATPYAAVCIALKAAGINPVNPSDPLLRTLVDAGATADEFVAAVPASSGKGQRFAYVLATVRGSRERAAAAAVGLHRGAMPAAPPVTTPGESVEAYQARMAAEREAERQRLAGSRGPSPEVKAKLAELAGGMRIG